MIDTVSIISDGGVVLWQQSTHETGRRPMVNKLIQEVLLEDRAGLTQYSVGDYQLRWALENDAKFFVVAVYPKFFKPHYMQNFLRDIAATFAKKYGKQTATDLFAGCDADFNTASAGKANLMDFGTEYATLLDKFNASEEMASRQGANGEGVAADAGAGASDDAGAEEEDEEAEKYDGGVEAAENEAQHTAHRSGKVIVTKDGRRLVIGGPTPAAAGGEADAAGAAAAPPSAGGASRKRNKKPTKWNSPGAVVDPMVEQQSHQKKATEAELQAQANVQRETYIRRLPNGAIAPVKEREWEGQSRGRLATWLRSYMGTRSVDKEDLRNIIPDLREKLIAKNVAVEVAEHVCNSVEASLAGKKLGTFDSLYKTVDDAMTASLHRILQPKREVNILRDVATAKAAGKPYSIVLCGVNGVGKSTSLAKMTYWLQQNGNSVLLAAGDTFRHGAVEQLEVHGRCLGAPVFQLGYGTDPSAVAAAAITQASKQHTNVVMIDTAGRMQDHESRMRALAKLIHDNQPDLVLFVGEALVGNNGIDQLRKFNQCLVDFAPVGARSRGIDGIVLTKFDTIDDKVGAALSMVYELGQPIVFVGVGQTYQDLKVIEPEVVVSALMK
ncbi:putative signal recognition particle receptor like protein [Leptomonas pyrrhocoris]|uniref:Putative signal recognition particle receptor like protein n=1 Tax=Leptomonas pyrrhocoris TaxID=157538 RepID=A0A0N0DW70_LEPPY|nr:putative signal recognition particle receptor like protein [Leptomonas pyrrhocoris]KPA81364.1 putative signal recognition particle receptor like protein [Leptomonas pyrrhocoris]|eukprot:XP_015659803.1 putative signal recognition particle receptor like protein [Leptomonas pyrrhocoris]